MKNTAYFFIVTTAIIVALIYGKSLLIPFVFALLIWFVVRKIRQRFNKINIVKKHFPSWLKSLTPSVLLIAAFVFISKLLMANINALAKSYPLYG